MQRSSPVRDVLAVVLAAAWLGGAAAVASRAHGQQEPSGQPAVKAEAASLVEVPSDIPPAASRYSILVMGNAAGAAAEWRTADGGVHDFFAFNDRGRGPRTLEKVVLAPDGCPASVELTGNDYLKSPVSESFAVENGVASWKNPAEQGTARLVPPSCYLNINPTSLQAARLVRAALKNGGKMALLPGGALTVRKVSELKVSANGRTETIDAYALAGLDLAPDILWLDRRQELFADADSWLTVIRTGWEASTGAILKARARLDDERAAELALHLPHRPPGPVVFDDVAVFDAEHAAIVPHQRVVVAGRTIQSVGPMGAAALPAGAERVDGRGRTLLPGLWDMHAHVGANDGLLNLAAGVTSVRDLGNDNDELNARRKRIESGHEVGTRIFPSGFIDGRGPYQAPTKVLASSEQDARDDVRMYARMGYAAIKIYSSLPPAFVPAIIEEAHQRGMRVSGHIPAGMTAREAVGEGLDEIQHINYIFLNFMPDVKNTETPARFTEPAKRAAALDLQSKEVRDFIALLDERHVVVDVTLATFENMFTGSPGRLPDGWQGVADRLPIQVRRSLLTGTLPAPPGLEATYRDSYAAFLKMTGLLYRAGVQLETGTDDFAGFALDRELELHVKAGIPPAKALQNATWDAARIMKKDAELGSIAPGKVADLALVVGDPTEDISRVRRVALVVRDGIVYHPAELLAELGIAPSR